MDFVPKRTTLFSVGSRLERAIKSRRKGEILRVKTATERKYVLMLAAARGWDIHTEKEGKQYRVIAA